MHATTGYMQYNTISTPAMPAAAATAPGNGFVAAIVPAVYVHACAEKKNETHEITCKQHKTNNATLETVT